MPSIQRPLYGDVVVVRSHDLGPAQSMAVGAGVPHGFGQVVGLGLYFWMMWSRIRPVGSHLREAKGERF